MGVTPLKLVVVLTAAILGEVSVASFDRIFRIRGKFGSGAEDVPDASLADVVRDGDADVDVVLVLVVEVVGVAFEILNAKWLL